jgi:hypothetical protein
MAANLAAFARDFLGVVLDRLKPFPCFLEPELQLALKSLVGEHGTELLVKRYFAPQVIAPVHIAHTVANTIATVRSGPKQWLLKLMRSSAPRTSS